MAKSRDEMFPIGEIIVLHCAVMDTGSDPFIPRIELLCVKREWVAWSYWQGNLSEKSGARGDRSRNNNEGDFSALSDQLTCQPVQRSARSYETVI